MGSDDHRVALSIDIIEQSDATATVALVGELDMNSAPTPEQVAEGLVDAGVTTLVIDCAGLTFMDSSGLRVLAGIHDRIEPDGGSILLRRPSRIVRQVITATGLDTLIEIDG